MTKPKRQRPYKNHTLESLRARCIEEGDCWLWQGAATGGVPSIGFKGKTVYVRRYILEVLQGRSLGHKQRTTPTCFNHLCINPEHIMLTSRSIIQKRWTNHAGYMQAPARRLKITVSRRERSPYSLETVQKVHDMEGTMSQRAIARTLGTSRNFVQKLLSGKSWQPLNNPWAGLLTPPVVRLKEK